MTRTAAQAIYGFFFVAGGLAVLIAGPLTSQPIVALIQALIVR